MKNILRNRTILGIASILLSLIICFGLTPLFNDALGAKTSVVRVTEPIEKGELITSKKIQVIEVGGFNMHDSVLKVLQQDYQENPFDGETNREFWEVMLGEYITKHLG